MIRITVGFLLASFFPSMAHTQGLELGPRVSIGGGSALTVQGAVRASLLWQRWGIHGELGARATSTGCSQSLSGGCTLPASPAWELTTGVTGLFPGSPMYVSLGAGVTHWDRGTHPVFAGEVGGRLSIARALRVVLGVRGLTIPGVERSNVRRVNVRFLEALAGFTVLLGSP